MILLLLSVSHWPVIIIGPGGLLLVVPHPLFVVPVSVLWVGVQKSKKVKLDVKNKFAGSHIENRRRCSNSGANIKWGGGAGCRFGLASFSALLGKKFCP